MILTVHIADLGVRSALRVLRRHPEPSTVSGLRYAVMTTAGPLRTGRAIVPQPGRVGLIAVWDDDTKFDQFQESSPWADPGSAGCPPSWPRALWRSARQ